MYQTSTKKKKLKQNKPNKILGELGKCKIIICFILLFRIRFLSISYLEVFGERLSSYFIA